MGEIYDVAIIGSGPAGLTAALYTARANLKTLVLAGSKWGGQLMLTTTVENFPGFPDGIQGPELMEKMKAQVERFGVKIILEDATAVSGATLNYQLKTTNSVYHAKAIIIATGADTMWLGLPNEQRLIGHGVSSCAPCDAYFFKGKKVAVVGGGDSAMEEALVLTNFATEVTIIHRRDTFRASKIMQDRVLNHPKIKVLWNTEITDVLGKAKVEGIALKSTVNPKQTSLMNLDGLFIAIGLSPNSKIFADLLPLDPKGYLIRKETLNEDGLLKYWSTTATPGIFVAGDVHDYHYKQAITAAGFGCMAAMDVEKWLDSKNLRR